MKIFDFCYGEAEEGSSLPIRKAMNIVCQVGIISKSMSRLCVSHIQKYPIDANFYQFETDWNTRGKIFHIIHWMIKKHLKLGRLDISCAERDLATIIYLFRNCDTSLLQYCGVKHGLRLNGSIILAACHLFSGIDLHDLTVEDQVISSENMARALKFPTEIIKNISVTIMDLQQVLLEKAPSLTGLKLRLNEDKDRLLAFPHVIMLELSTRFGRHSTGQWKRIADAIPQMANLIHLKLSASPERDTYVCINSETLAHIDVYDCGKQFWVEECVCPALASFICLGCDFGNGVRPVLPRQGKMDMVSYDHLGGDMQVLHKDLLCEGMSVPPTCLISFNGGMTLGNVNL